MRDVLKDLELWSAEGERVALATLVGVQGAAPRAAGARMALTASGRMTGSVSGGCVENDVMDRAKRVLESGKPELATYEIVSDDDPFEVGLHCGSIEVLIEPHRPDAAWSLVSKSLAGDAAVALVTALGTANGDVECAPLGSRLALTGDESAGSMAKGVDEAAKAYAAARLATGGPAERVSLEAGGASVDAFVEIFEPRPRLFVVGATHIAVPLCEMAARVGFRVAIVDPRKPFATPERFPAADELCHRWPEQAFAGDVLEPESYVVAVSHDAKFDVPALAAAMRANARYIGALGSRKTHARRVEKLREAGFADTEIRRIHAPVGLDIGAVGAEEIAVAIVAQLLAVRRDAEGGPGASS